MICSHSSSNGCRGNNIPAELLLIVTATTPKMLRVFFFFFDKNLSIYPNFRYGRIFKTNLVGKDLIVSLDPELNNYLFQQEEKAFQIWFPESFMRILGDENLVLSSGSFHKNIRNMILRVFGPENLRLVLLHDVQGAVKRSLNSWLEMPSIELKPAISSVWTSQLSFKQAPASINVSDIHLLGLCLRTVLCFCR